MVAVYLHLDWASGYVDCNGWSLSSLETQILGVFWEIGGNWGNLGNFGLFGLWTLEGKMLRFGGILRDDLDANLDAKPILISQTNGSDPACSL